MIPHGCSNRRVHYAEPIAIRVHQYHEVGAGPVTPRVASCPQLHEAFDLCRLVRRIEVQVDPAMGAGGRRPCLE